MFPVNSGRTRFIIESRIRHRSCKIAVTILTVVGYHVTIKHLGLYRLACHSHVSGRGVVGLIDFFHQSYMRAYTHTHKRDPLLPYKS